MPRTRDDGIIIAPSLYPRFLRQVANLCDALTAFEEPDETNRESPHFVGHACLPIWDEQAAEDDDPTRGLVGWVVQEDIACWTFYPYVEQIEVRPGD
jgi:hypothetical protein